MLWQTRNWRFRNSFVNVPKLIFFEFGCKGDDRSNDKFVAENVDFRSKTLFLSLKTWTFRAIREKLVDFWRHLQSKIVGINC